MILKSLNRFSKLAALAIIFLFMGHIAGAAYLENLPTVVTNPDGTKIECFSSGDEFFNYLHDKDGFTIIQGEDGYYYYATKEHDELVPSEYRVNSVDPKSKGLVPKTLISSEAYKERVNAFWSGTKDNGGKAPHIGELNNLVIYIRFNDDTEFTLPRGDYDNRFNNSNQASLKHYFNEVSYDQLEIESYHYPVCEMTTNLSYQDTQNRSFFQPYNSSSNPNGYQNDSQRAQREHQLLKRAITALADDIPSDINWDGDSDGYIDNVCFIIRGNSEGWNDLLWAHRWVLYTETVYINGKRVWDYTFQPENQAVVSTICHEMFHALGAPDLYRYNHDGFDPVGTWDIMHSGFSHMGAHMKYKYANKKWVTEIPVISEQGEYTLNPLTSDTNNAFRINSPNSGTQYFIVEYRKKEGLYEGNLPQSGLLVYRINPAATSGNANGPPDEVHVFRPGGTPTANGNLNLAALSADNPYDAIVDGTNFAPFLANGSAGGIQIVNVSEIGETITFTLINESYNVIFNVFDEKGPVKDARIRFNEEIYTTNNSGRRMIPNVFPGTYDYIVIKDGYQPFSGTAEVIDQDLDIDVNLLSVSVNTEIDKSLTIYPNPFTNSLTFKGTLGVERIVLYNTLGQKTEEILVDKTEEITVDTSWMSEGIHIVTIYFEDGNRITHRMIKQ